MKIRKGQSCIKLKEKIDLIDCCYLTRNDGLGDRALIAVDPQEILPFRPRLGVPESYCFVNDEIRLNRKSDKSAKLTVVGLKRVVQ